MKGIINVLPFNKKFFIEFAEGKTVKEILSANKINDDINLKVFVNDTIILPEFYDTRQILQDECFIVALLPGKNSKDWRKTFKVIGAIALGNWASNAVFGGLKGFFSTTKFGAAIKSSLITTGKSFFKNMALNAMIKPPKQNVSSGHTISMDPRTSSITGTNNQMNPYAPIPVLYGKHKIFPPLAAMPYTEVAGDDQYLRMLFCAGYGPISISNLKIGENDISYFVGAEFEIQETDGVVKKYIVEEGEIVELSSDNKISLFLNDVKELKLNYLLENKYDVNTELWVPNPIIKSIEDDLEIDEISVDISFPQGLVEFTDDNKKKNGYILFCLEYMDLDADIEVWKNVVDEKPDVSLGIKYKNYNDPIGGTLSELNYNNLIADFVSQGVLDNPEKDLFFVFGKQTSLMRKNITWRVPRGHYAVRVTRMTHDSDDLKIIDKVYFDVLRSKRLGRTIKKHGRRRRNLEILTPDVPAVNKENMSLIALKIKATNQVEGQIDKLSCLAERKYTTKIENISGDYQLSIVSPYVSRNPADAYLDVLRGVAVKDENKVSDEKIDYQAFYNWREECELAEIVSDQLYTTSENPNRITCADVTLILNEKLEIGDWVHVSGFNNTENNKFLKITEITTNYIEFENIVFTTEGPNYTIGLRKGRTFDAYIDGDTTVKEMLEDIASAGLATPAILDGKYTIVRDVQQNYPVQHFTPRNTWNFTGEKSFVKPPTVFKCSFINEENDYQIDELEIDFEPELLDKKTEDLKLFGIVNFEQVSKTANYFYKSGLLRPFVYTFYTDFEYLVCQQGDKIRFSHDVMSIGLCFGRIVSVTNNGTHITSVEVDEKCVLGTDIQYAVRIRTKNGKSILQNIQINEDTNPLETSTLVFDTPLLIDVPVENNPDEGDLFTFGQNDGVVQETIPLVVKSIEPYDNLTAKITAVDYVEELFDEYTYTVPEYNYNINVSPEVRRGKPDKPALEVRKESVVLSYPNDLLTDYPELPINSAKEINSDESVLVQKSDGTLINNIEICLANYSGSGVRPTHYGCIYREYNSGNIWSEMIVVPADRQRITISDVEEGKVYEIQIKSIAGDMHSEWVNHYDVENGEPELLHYAIGKTTPPPDVQNFNVSINSDNFLFSWDTSNMPKDVKEFIIKKEKKENGSYTEDWDNIEEIGRFSGNNHIINTSLDTGEIKFFIKAVDMIGLESINFTSLEIVLVPPKNILISNTVVGHSGSVSLDWEDATPDSGNFFPIKHYIVKKGSSFETGAIVKDNIKETGITIQENAEGTKKYWIVAEDILGNQSLEPTCVELTVENLFDFVFDSEKDDNTFVVADHPYLLTENAILDNGKLLMLVNDAIDSSYTLESHYVDNSWTSEADKIAAGYEYYALPGTTTAYYENIFDFEKYIDAGIIRLSYIKTDVTGSYLITPTLSYSYDMVSWVDQVGLDDLSIKEKFRYIKVRLDISSSSGDSLLFIEEVKVNLTVPVKTETSTSDTEIVTIQSDSGGTYGEIMFSKYYLGVDFFEINFMNEYMIDPIPSPAPLLPAYYIIDDFIENTESESDDYNKIDKVKIYFKDKNYDNLDASLTQIKIKWKLTGK